MHLIRIDFNDKNKKRVVIDDFEEEKKEKEVEKEMTNKTPKFVSVRDNKLKWCEVGSTVSESCLLYGKTPKFSVAREVQKMTNF